MWETTGASHALFDLADQHGWLLVTSAYVAREIEKNLGMRMSADAQREWAELRTGLRVVSDELILPWAVIFPASKGRAKAGKRARAAG